MLSKRTAIYRSANIEIYPPRQRTRFRSGFLIILLIIMYTALSVTIKPSALFATNSTMTQGTMMTLKENYETLLEMYTSLQQAYASLKNNYLDLRERYNDMLVLKSTLLITNEQYINERKELHDKVDTLQEMNKYLCDKLTTQEKQYNDLAFTVETYLDDYKKHLTAQQEEALRQYEEALRKHYEERTQAAKKPYREFMYSSYGKD
ncbi:MAG: hypothetical protein JW938_03390 [Candidatus Omnitrophica bacterium]|nr:hypothetical protein [Candidatus Omnitrophota bacterium]